MCRQVTVGTGGPTTWACEDTAPVPQGPAVGIWPLQRRNLSLSGERTMTVGSWLWPPCCGATPAPRPHVGLLGRGCRNVCFHFSGALIQVCDHKAMSCR